MSRPHFLTPVLGGASPWRLRIDRTGNWLATHASLAGSSRSRRRGLLDRDGLNLGEALVIAPTQGVHTFGMRFSIDVVGVGRDGVVVCLHRAVPKRRIVLSWRSFAMVEMAAGAIDQAKVSLGDRILAVSDPIL